MTTGRAEICSHRETRVRAMSTSLTSTRSSRTAQSAGSSLSKPWVGAPLPPDVTVPVWCRGESENRRPVNAEKAAPMVYHPRASRPARAFGEPEPPDPSSRARARSARVAAPVAAGPRRRAAPVHRGPARSRVFPRPFGDGGGGGGRRVPRSAALHHERRPRRRGPPQRAMRPVAAADAPRRQRAATRTCATSASTAAAARNPPHATPLDATHHSRARRVAGRAGRGSGAGRARARAAERAEEATNELRSTLALKKDEIDRAAAARTRRRRGRGGGAEGVSVTARGSPSRRRRCAADVGHEAHEAALRNVEGRVREARAAATAAVRETARTATRSRRRAPRPAAPRGSGGFRAARLRWRGGGAAGAHHPGGDGGRTQGTRALTLPRCARGGGRTRGS